MKNAISILLCVFLPTIINAQVVTLIAGGYFKDGGPAQTAVTIPGTVTCYNGILYFTSDEGIIYRIENDKLYLELGSRLFENTPAKADFTVDTDKFDLPNASYVSVIPTKNGEFYFRDEWRSFVARKTKTGKIIPVLGNFDTAVNYNIVEGMAATTISFLPDDDFAVDENNSIFLSHIGHIYSIDSNGKLKNFAGVDTLTRDSATHLNVPAKTVALQDILGMNFDSRGNIVAISKNLVYHITPGGMLSSYRYSVVSPNSVYKIDATVDTSGNAFIHDSNNIYKIDQNGVQTTILSFPSNSKLSALTSFCWITKDSFACVITDTLGTVVYTFGVSKTPTYVTGINLYNLLPVGWNSRNLMLGLPVTNSFCFDHNCSIVAPFNIRDEFSAVKDIRTIQFQPDGTFSSISSFQYNEIKSNGNGVYFLLDRTHHKFYRTDFKSTPQFLDSVSGMSATKITDWCLTPNDEILYFSQFTIRKIDSNGNDTVIAGTGYRLNTGDDGAAKTAGIASRNIACDKLGNIYVADFGLSSLHCRIRKINTYGIITTIGGKGSDSLDGALAINADLGAVSDMKIDTAGNIYFKSGKKLKVILANGCVKTICNSDSSTIPPFIDTMSAIRFPFSSINEWNIDDSGRIIAVSNYSIVSTLFRFPSLYRYSAPDTTIDTAYSLQLYPNPANAELHIKYYTPKPGAIQMAIIDGAGRKIQTFETTTTTGLINETIELPRGMQTGVYFLKIVTPTGGDTKKFAVQR